MIRYTNEFSTDGDITIERVANRLKLISEGIKNSNKLNLCDINVICEEIFGKILNTLYGYELVTIGVQGKPHYVAIDLVDKKNKVAYQVTSTVRRSKIEGTTEKFVKNKLYKDIDELYILILNDDPHKYRNDNNEIDIKTTKKFTIKNNVINFEKLITEIETKSKNNPKLLTKIYGYVNMVFETGRLSWESIISKTNELSQENIYNTKEYYTWKKGFGDVSLFAFIPKSYKEKLSCVVEFRKYNIEGAIISIDQEKLLKDYFVTKEVFQNKHIIGRETLDDDSWIEIENIRMKINAYSAYHLYCLFNDLHNVYKEAQIEINKIMGTEGLAEKNGKYLIANVSKEQWFRIIEFAQKHDCYSYNENGDEEWNIFDNKSVIDFFYLSPYFYGNKDKGIIHAEIRVEFLYNDTVNVFWIPGYKDTSYNCMEYFDNVVKWKADYTKEWFWNALIPKIREDEKEVKNKAYENSFFKKVVGIKNKIKKFLA